MNIGILWFDNSELPLNVNIQKAIDYYREKYNCSPNLCLVHPSTLRDEKLDDVKIKVRPYRPVLPGHLWLGMEDA